MVINNAKSCIIDGVNLFTKYRMILASLDKSSTYKYSNSGDTNVNIEKSDYSDRASIISKTKNDTLEITLSFFRQEGESFKPSQVEEINRLFDDKSNEYKKFQFFGDIDYVNIYYYVVCTKFNVIRIAGSGEVKGIEVELKTNSSHAWGDKIEMKYSLTNGAQIIHYDDNGAIGEVFPDIEIKIFSNGNFVLKNEMTNRTIEILNCVNGEIIKINGTTKEIVSNIRNDINYDEFKSWLFTIGNTYKLRENHMNYTGTSDAEFTFSYIPSRLVGL